MNKLQKYVDRLTREWLQHKNIIIAVDFDDTISPWGLNTTQECNWVVEKLKVYQQQGAYITIFTACNTDRFEDISNFCNQNGLMITGINKNALDLPYGNHGKIYANVFLDDRAGLLESIEILDGALANIKGKKENAHSEFEQFKQPYTT
jgi:hypothetical protein